MGPVVGGLLDPEDRYVLAWVLPNGALCAPDGRKTGLYAQELEETPAQ